MSNYRDFLLQSATSPQIAVVPHASTSAYNQNDLVALSGKIYRAIAAIPIPKVFDPADWDEIGKVTPVVFPPGLIADYDPTAIYSINDFVLQSGALYQNTIPIPVGEPFDPVKWDRKPLAHGVGVFDSAADYVQNDIVAFNGKLYRALAAVPAAPFTAAQWDEIGGAPKTAISAFDPAAAYVQDDLVVYNASIYAAIGAVTPGPFSAADWQKIDVGAIQQAITVHDVAVNYAAGDLVTNAGKIYRAKAAVPANPFDPVEWEEVGGTPPPGLVAAYDATKTYAVNELTVFNGELYRCTAAVVTPEGFDPAKWDHIDAGAQYVITHFDATRTYKQNDLVFNQGYVYRARGPVAAGPFSAGDWEAMQSGIGGKLKLAIPGATEGDYLDLVYVQQDATTFTAGDGFYAKMGVGWVPIDLTKILPPFPTPILDAFDATAAYPINALVVETGKIYRANGAVTAKAFDPTEWTEVGAPQAITLPINAFDARNPYAQNDMVTMAGKLYTAKAAIIAKPFNPVDWTEIGAPPPPVVHPIDAHDATATYAANDLVINNGRIFRANAPVGPKAFVATDWTEIGAPPPAVAHPINAFDPTANYTLNDMVIESGKIYAATGAIVPKPFDPTEWTELGAPELPAGGTIGQLLTKQSAAVGDAQWVDPVAELPVGGTTGQVLEKQSAADGDVVWNDLPVITHPIDAHDPTATYAANDLVIEAGKIYRANGAVGPKTFTPADWDEIGAPPPVTAHGVKLYDAASTYTALDLVAKDGELYRAKVNVPAEAFDITKWDHIDAGAHEVLVHWEATQDYSSDDLVFLGGHVYKAINAVPAGPFDPTKWDMMESGIGGQYMMLPPLATDGDDWDFVFVQLDPTTYTAGDGFYAKLPGGWQPIDISKVLPNELPAAGTPGQVLAKKTAADGDVEWIGPVVHPIDAFDATAAYAQGDIVIESGKLYSALGAVTAGAFDPTEWDHIGRRTLAGKAIEPQPAVTLADDGDLIYVPEHSDAAVWTKGGSPGVYVNSVNSGYKLSFTELMGAPTVSLGGLGGKLGPGEFTHTGLTVTEEGGTAQTLAITGVAGSAWGWAKSNPTFTPAELAFFNDLKDHNIDSIHCDLPNLNITSGLISGYMYFKANGVWNTIYIKNSEQPTPGTLVLRDGNGGVAANIITCTESRNSGNGRISGDLIVQGDLTEQGHKFLRQFEQNKNYVAGDPILWNNWIYTANGAVAAGSTWAAADWTKYGTISDEALKENVRDEGDALPIINQLRPVTFEWGEKHGGADPGTRRGFIAQEVEKVLPDVIFDSAMNGGDIYKGIEYLELISLQTKAIQELSAQVEELKKEVAALKGA